MAESDAADPRGLEAKKEALHLMRRGMDMSGQWRHEEALGHFDRALLLVPTGRFARMALELKLATLRTLGRDAEADALQAKERDENGASSHAPTTTSHEEHETNGTTE